jgi:inhibitor of cysteine peptidase
VGGRPRSDRAAVAIGHNTGGEAMKKSDLVLIAAGALIASMIAACSTAVPTPQEITVDEGADGTTVSLSVNDELVVTLRGNPTTGYTWAISETNTTILAAQGEPTFTPESDMMGAPGQVVMRFKAIASGTAPLVLAYRRPFEPDVEPAATFAITVDVAP